MDPLIALGLIALGTFLAGAVLGGVIGFMVGRKTMRVNRY